MEEEYPDSLVADQMYYNLARVYGKKRDFANSKKYFNKVISSYPQSVFVAKAKKSLFLLGKI
jgi:TolA-binding protein